MLHEWIERLKLYMLNVYFHLWMFPFFLINRTLVNRSLAKQLVGGTTATRGIKSIRFSRINSHNDSWNNILSISWFLQRILSVNFLLNCNKPKIGSILSETGSKLTFEHFLFIAERVNILLVKITFVLKCEKKGNLFGKTASVSKNILEI